MRAGAIGIGVSFPIGGLGAGVAGDVTAPEATSVSYDTGTDTLTLTVSEPCRVFAMHNASATPLSAATIEAGNELVSGGQLIAAGLGYINWDDVAWGAGTWYLHIMLKDSSGNTTVLTPIQHIIAASFVTSAYRFDGTNDWLSATSLTTPTASEFGTFGIGFRVPSPWPAGSDHIVNFRKGGSTGRFIMRANRNSDGVTLDSGRVSVTVYNDAGSSDGNFALGDFELEADEWISLVITYDTREAVTADRWKIRRANGSGAWGTPTLAYTAVMPLNLVVGATADVVVGAEELNGSFKFPAWDLAYLYYAPGQLADITNTTVRDKFRCSDGGRLSDGSGITGSAPFLFLEDTTLASFKTNKGTGGGLTENGALTAAGAPLP